MSPSIFKSNPSPPAKMLAYPRWGKPHTFNDIAHLVWTNLLWGKSVGVLCLTRETLRMALTPNYWLTNWP